MTRQEMLALLREIEFAGWNQDGYDPSHGYCPSCGVDPESGLAFEPEKHGGGCRLAETIAWLEDEENAVYHMPIDVEKGWVLR